MIAAALLLAAAIVGGSIVFVCTQLRYAVEAPDDGISDDAADMLLADQETQP